jgi:LTXXQ motif family protein
MRLKTWLLAACTAMALAGTPALAQEEDQPGFQTEHGMEDMGPGGMQDGMMGRGDMSGMMGRCPRMADMMGGHGMMRHGMKMPSRPMTEARLAFIKADLDITEAQLPQWDAYAEAVRSRQKTMSAMHEDMKNAKDKDALERMDTRIKSMETLLEGLRALQGPAQALYASLSDEQKKRADQLLGGRCGMM